MGLKRREFLQQIGLGLAALGLSEASWAILGKRTAQALAEPAGRKLALLVGINQYPALSRNLEPLQGPLTDVELQQQLLLHRLGFQKSDILTLTNEQATRDAIETAFITHLVEQAKPGDLVLFHFSGYGCCIPRLNPEPNFPVFQHSLVPVDGTLIKDGQEIINDVLEDTLSLLLRSLSTDKIITVLDTSYTYPGQNLQGTLRIRSSITPTFSEINPDELARQDQLLSQLQLSRQDLQRRSLGQLPGLVMAAAKPSQIATEIKREGYSAGLFTYALTQTLWTAMGTNSLPESFAQVAGEVERRVGSYQQPQLKSPVIVSPERSKQEAFVSLLSLASPPADGVITGLEDNGKTAMLLLGGIPSSILDVYGLNSLLRVVSETKVEESQNITYLQVRSRTGLKAKAQFRSWDGVVSSVPLQIGQRVQEVIRVLPQQIDLKVALDPQLARIERVDATSAFAGISQVSLVAGDQSPDYLLSRMRETAIAQNPSAPLPTLSQSRYGLFSLGQGLLPGTVGEGGEAVKVAVHRLIPQLRTRLAQKLLGLTINHRSSRLKVKAILAMLAPQAKALMKAETGSGVNGLNLQETRKNLNLPENIAVNSNVKRADGTQEGGMASATATLTPTENLGMVSIPMGSRIQYQLQNNGEQPIYFILFHLDSQGQAYILDPTLDPAASGLNPLEPLPHQQFVAPGKTLSLPGMGGDRNGTSTEQGQIIHKPPGVAESYLIVSESSFVYTLASLEKTLKTAGNHQKMRPILNPLEVAEALLTDLSSASQEGVGKAGLFTDELALDVDAWATFNFIYRVI